ncbi:MAG TPA: hypothetical protein VH741_03480, partial [Candidatus Limnocylindrales bacterium]
MVRRHLVLLRSALMAADVLSAMALFVLVSVLRLGDDWALDFRRAGIHPGVAALAYGIGWLGVVWLHGMYRLRARWSLRTDVVILLRATAILLVVTLVLLVLLQISEVSRFILVVLFSGQALVSIASRVLLRQLFAYLRSRGHVTRYMLVCGAGSLAQDFADRVERHPDLGLRVIGHLRSSADEGPPPTRPVLGELAAIEDVLHQRVVDEVAICLPVAAWDLAEPITRLCESEGKFVRIPGDGRGPTISGGVFEEFDGMVVESLL